MSFKIQHSPDFQKPVCGGRTKWFDRYCPFKLFSTVFFKAWNSWIQFLFYFFHEHHLKTLKKEQSNFTHVGLVVILQIFIKNTYGLAYVAFSNISSRLWLGDNTIWRILSIKEFYQVFIQAYKPFTTSKTFRNFQSRTIWFDPYCPFKKKKKQKKRRKR